MRWVKLVEEVMWPTPEGVGVKGGGLKGESWSGAGLRLLGRGVVGRLGRVSFCSLLVSMGGLIVSLGLSCVVMDDLLFRFLGAGAGFAAFSGFAFF